MRSTEVDAKTGSPGVLEKAHSALGEGKKFPSPLSNEGLNKPVANLTASQSVVMELMPCGWWKVYMILASCLILPL